MATHEIVRSKTNLPVHLDIYQVDNSIVPNHWHAHIEVIYLCEGSMQVICNEQKYLLNQHDLFVVNSGDIHYTRSIGKSKIILLQIPYSLISQTISNCSTLSFQEYYSESKLCSTPAYKKLLHQLMSMKKLYLEKPHGYQFLFNSSLQLFLYLLYHNFSSRKDIDEVAKESKSSERLKMVISYVEEHYAENINLHDIAELVSLNPEYFCRYFKKYMGFTFIEYVNMVRLNHIHADILSTKDNIITIQERHGFSNYKVFNRMFKEVYGCTPSVLRRKQI